MTRTRTKVCPVCGKEYQSSFPHCSQNCRRLASQSSRTDKQAWYELQLEVARPLSGRVVRGGRPGRYSDVETPHHLAECKLTDASDGHVDAFWVLKTQELARRFHKFPVLALAIGGLAGSRVAFFLHEEPRDTSRAVGLFLPVLTKWAEAGRDVWVAGMNQEFFLGLPGKPEPIPGLGSLLGVKFSMDWTKVKQELSAKFDEELQRQKDALAAAKAAGDEMLRLQGKFQMADEAEKQEQKDTPTVTTGEANEKE